MASSLRTFSLLRSPAMWRANDDLDLSYKLYSLSHEGKTPITLNNSLFLWEKYLYL